MTDAAMTPGEYADALCTCPRCGILRTPYEVTEPQPDVLFVHLGCDPCQYGWRIEMVRVEGDHYHTSGTSHDS